MSYPPEPDPSAGQQPDPQAGQQPPYPPQQPGYPQQQQPGFPAQGQYGAPGYGVPGYGAPGYGAPGYGQVPPTSSKATTSLVLGIVSLVACGLLTGIPAIIIGRQAKAEIQASNGRLGGEGNATAGLVLGIIGTAWSALMVLFVLGVFVLGGVIEQSYNDACNEIVRGDGSYSNNC